MRGIDTINVAFKNCDPKKSDWVALFDIRTDPTNLIEQNAEAWVRLCGDKDCEDEVSAGTIAFRNELANESGRQTWPLRKNGLYAVHLIRGSSSYATTGQFVVARYCQ